MSDLRNLKNIVVVGGGTAGWLTALYARIALPTSTITVVESDDIGILGAGEGTIPDFVDYLDFLGIPVSRLVKEADATLKTSIKFTNWQGDNSHYHHPFYTDTQLGLNGCNILHPNLSRTNIGLVINSLRDDPLDNIDLVEVYSKKNKVPFYKKDIPDGWEMDPIFRYSTDTRFAVHFNATKLANTLRNIGTERGIKVIKATVVEVDQDSYGDISKLHFKEANSIEVDFLFDCTGFKRFFIGDIYKSEWRSHADHLTVNAAVPFFLPIEKEIPPYTDSIAMKYGWMWKIPTRERYGCGYVYNSNLITEEEAIKEIEEYLGYEPEYPRKDKGGFKFEAGYYKQPWINNCVAIGLSGGFIEPLEATSIWVTTMTLQSVLGNTNNMRIRHNGPADEVNRKFVDRNKQVLDFIYFHYMNGRQDTDFWKHYSYENAPEGLKDILDTWEYRVPEYQDFVNKLFILNSWMMIAQGKKTLDKEILRQTSDIELLDIRVGDTYNSLIEKRKQASESFVSHKDFLEDLAK